MYKYGFWTFDELQYVFDWKNHKKVWSEFVF